MSPSWCELKTPKLTFRDTYNVFVLSSLKMTKDFQVEFGTLLDLLNCTKLLNTVNIFLLGSLKMTKTPNLTLINTNNFFALGALKRIKTPKLSLELYFICRLHNNGRYSQCFSTWPFENNKDSQVALDIF